MTLSVFVRTYISLILWVMFYIQGHYLRECFYTGTPVNFQTYHSGYDLGIAVTFDLCHPSGKVMISHNASGCFIHDEFKDRMFITSCYGGGSVDFTLEDLNINDSGEYCTCHHSTFSWNRNIEVIGRTTAIRSDPRIPRFGEQLCLTCEMPDNGWKQKEIGARWVAYKNGKRRILSEGNITLCLDSLTVKDNGDSYKCTLMFNGAKIGTSELFIIQLYIPATIEQFTANNCERSLEIKASGQMEISCMVLTSLPTNVTIRYVTGNQSEVIETSKVVTFNVSSACDMSGIFECEAVTMYGQRVVDNIDVIIKCPPKLSPIATEVNAKLGRALNIVIPAQGNALNATVDGIHGVSVNKTIREITLSKTTLTSSDFRTINLTVSNEFGEDSSLIVIQPTGVPETPTDLTVSTIGQDSLMLSWLPGFQGGSNQTFAVEYRHANQSWQNITNVTTSEIDISYIPDEQYYFRVRGHNDEGESSWSPELFLLISKNITVTSLPTQNDASDMDLIVAVATTAVVVTCMFVFLVYVAVMFYRRNRTERDDNTLLVPRSHPSLREQLNTRRLLSGRGLTQVARRLSSRDHSPIRRDPNAHGRDDSFSQGANNVGDQSPVLHPSILRSSSLRERPADDRRLSLRDRPTSDSSSNNEPRSSVSNSLRDHSGTTTGSSPEHTSDIYAQSLAIPRSTVEREEDMLHTVLVTASRG